MTRHDWTHDKPEHPAMCEECGAAPGMHMSDCSLHDPETCTMCAWMRKNVQ